MSEEKVYHNCKHWDNGECTHKNNPSMDKTHLASWNPIQTPHDQEIVKELCLKCNDFIKYRPV